MAISKSYKKAGFDNLTISDISVETPNNIVNGDFSTNIAMISAKDLKMTPHNIAELLVGNFDTQNTYIDKIEIAGPGFINFFLSREYLFVGLNKILELGKNYGKLDIGAGKKVMVEFVSANPTGPLHMGNARGGALGDLIAAVLEKAGYEVVREFLINDEGNQIEKFGISLEARYLQHFLGEDKISFPEDGYMGKDITEQAKEYAKTYGDSLLNQPGEVRRSKLSDYALKNNIDNTRKALKAYGIEFDSWFSEKELFETEELNDTIKYLDEKGYTYEEQGAKWFKTTMFGSEKDDVLVRNNGITTYFATDIAYHRNKFQIRNFDRVINLLGADHHGHVSRMYSACEALGVGKDKLEIVVFQLVRLMRNGKTARMSKRTGKAISLEDLIEEVGRDAVRFFFNMKASGSHLDFDLDLAVKQSNDNPVFYIQYAHARICSILRKIKEECVEIEDKVDLSLLSTVIENKLIDKLLDYPEEIRICTNTLEPSRLTRYAIDIASLFHSFYNAYRVIGEEAQLFTSRVKLIEAVKIVLGNVLELMKISAPERM